jgi:excinuclease ABC subunit C
MVILRLKEKLKALPDEPGVYLMKDKTGNIIYIGKAKNLRSRLMTYIADTRDERALMPFLAQEIADIETVVGGNEKEALILENELIKRHKPRFNIKLKEGGTFVYLRLDLNETYPRLEVTRQVKKDDARYFGPYPAARALRETLRVINRYFKLRTCSDHDPSRHKRPCLLCQISTFPEPSVYDMPPDEYHRHVKDAVSFLQGKKPELLDSLRQRMEKASGNLNFEEAARLRDRIGAIKRTLEPQTVIFETDMDGERQVLPALIHLQKQLRLEHIPRRMECFDVSHFKGNAIVAAKAAMKDGKPDKSRYRRFKIRSVTVGDDYTAMHEAVLRRLKHGMDENDLPDLIVLDGGKGQLGAARRAMTELNITGIDMIAIAKDRGKRREHAAEYIYLPGKKKAVVLKQSSAEQLMLMRLRDEAHRFAITYQQKLLHRTTIASTLDRIPGIGSRRRRSLLRRFGSVKRIAAASVDDLAQTEGIGQKTARKILIFLKNQGLESFTSVNREKNRHI